MHFELREMDFFTIIDKGLKLFKSNFVPLVILMAIFFGPFLLAMNYNQYKLQSTSNFPGRFLGDVIESISKQEPVDFEGYFDELLVDNASRNSFIYLYAFAFLMLILTPLAYLSSYRVLLAYIKGEKIELGKAIRFSATRYWTLLVAYAAFGMALYFSICLIVGFVFIFPALAFQVMLPCVVAIENKDISGSLKRNFNFLKGFYWRTFGIYLVIAIIVGLVTSLFASVGETIGGLLPGVLGISFKATISTMFSVIFQPIILCVIFLAYLDIRIRKEGFDLDILADRALGAVSEEPSSPPPSTDDAWK
jgi:hypothetical protein